MEMSERHKFKSNTPNFLPYPSPPASSIPRSPINKDGNPKKKENQKERTSQGDKRRHNLATLQVRLLFFTIPSHRYPGIDVDGKAEEGSISFV